VPEKSNAPIIAQRLPALANGRAVGMRSRPTPTTTNLAATRSQELLGVVVERVAEADAGVPVDPDPMMSSRTTVPQAFTCSIMLRVCCNLFVAPGKSALGGTL